MRSGQPTSTYGLLERLRQGDAEAFSLLFRKYSTRLTVLISLKLGAQLRRNLDVEDVLQEVFMVASRDLGNFTYQSPGSLMNWLARIADHTIADLARRASRKKRHWGEQVRLRSQSSPEGVEPEDPQTPSRILVNKERLKIVIDRLQNLPEQQQQVIVMARVEGVPIVEISEKLGKSREAVAVLLHRALRNLRQQTSEAGSG
jgi:RNA polymerase sigma-70 factor, ECF subfamily